MMPTGSELVIVGLLSSRNINLIAGNILYGEKTVRGFTIFKWIASKKGEERRRVHDMVAQDLKNGGKLFGSNYVKAVDLEDYKEGFELQSKMATEGKILLRVNN